MQQVHRAELDRIGRIAAVPSILDVVCRTTGMGFAVVARVTPERWVACEVLDRIDFGLEPGGELKVETTICDEVRSESAAVVIDHVAEDEIYCGHPTPAMYGFQSYISMPIRLPDGTFFGTLCAIDPRPARVKNSEIIGMFELFADLIGFHVDAQIRLETAESSLASERETAKLREQFIAVLGHDLRNPVATIASGARIIGKSALDERARAMLTVLQGSAMRMSGLIDNLLDFARGRLGGGIELDTRCETALAPVLQQVVDELKVVHPERRIDLRFDLDAPVRCDPARVAQLLSNLLANALTHGPADEAVRVEASSADGGFELRVVNSGEPIPEAARPQLFQPFVRGDQHSSAQGLGLGLYISAEIAKAHGGTLEVRSDAEETCFTLIMPANG